MFRPYQLFPEFTTFPVVVLVVINEANAVLPGPVLPTNVALAVPVNDTDVDVFMI
jgi:hypothetical protein